MTVSLLHERWRRRVSLLAAGALAGAEREAAERHARACEACAAELQALRSMIAAIPQEDVPEIPLRLLVSRVEAGVDAALVSPAARVGWKLLALPVAAAAALAAIALVPPIVQRLRPAPTPSVAIEAALPNESMLRLEHNLSREHAARYLSDAQDVLANVAARLPHCERGQGGVDVGEEARRSRALLERRALLVEDTDALASVRPVIDDVDNALREVASLDECARGKDLEAIHDRLERQRLLMKIDLMTRELAG